MIQQVVEADNYSAATRKAILREANFLIVRITYIVGMITRSTSVRNAFELYVPFLDLCKSMLGRDAKHRKAIAQRKESNAALRAMIERCGPSVKERWPRTIGERFSALGHPNDYRTFYSRVSSEVHGDAEETIRYFIGKLGTQEQFEAMALETLWTTRMYVHYAISWFVRASIMYALRYGMAAIVTRLKSELDVVDAELLEISKHIGAEPNELPRIKCRPEFHHR